MLASVVIPARNASETLGDTLAALAAQDAAGEFEVIVADDGSTDDTANIAGEGGPNVRLVQGDWGGPGPARNAGARAASGPVLAFTDADCVPAPEWLRLGLDAIQTADLVQGRVEPDPRAALGPFDRSIWVHSENGLYECANLFVRRELFESLGGFEDWLPVRLGKPLAEDAWLGWRVRRTGASSRFQPGALVHHAVFPRSAVSYIAERARLAYFPAIVRKMPEIRSTLAFWRIFLSPRSAAFDLAFVAALAALLAGTTLPLVATVPYLIVAFSNSRRWGRRAPVVAAAGLGADAVGGVALLVGSIRARSVLL